MSGKPWHKADATALDRLRAELAEHYPSLHFTGIVDDWVRLLGSLPVEHEGQELGLFKVQMWVPPGFPKDPPRLWEVGGRIPRTLDRHVYPKPGNCCFFYPDEFRLRHPEGMPLLDFLRGPVRDYFLGQMAVESGKPWPFGERAHGRDGGFEFYEEVLGVKGREPVLAYLTCLSYETLKGHHRCPCGSGVRLRQCHRLEIEGLRKAVPRDMAHQAAKRLSTSNGEGKNRASGLQENKADAVDQVRNLAEASRRGQAMAHAMQP